jgi:hypothetical protein
VHHVHSEDIDLHKLAFGAAVEVYTRREDQQPQKLVVVI